MLSSELCGKRDSRGIRCCFPLAFFYHVAATVAAGCVGDELVTLYCHHHQVACALQELLFTVNDLPQQLLGCLGLGWSRSSSLRLVYVDYYFFVGQGWSCVRVD